METHGELRTTKGRASHSPRHSLPPLSTRRALAPLTPTRVYDTFWRFAYERQRIYTQRLSAAPQPWTVDPVLLTYKFTNVYRVCDRVSQYLLRHVIYDSTHSNEDLFLRTLLFKFFNKISTWRHLLDECGELNSRTFSVSKLDRVLTRAKERSSIYSAAYIMPSAGALFGTDRKHLSHLKLLDKMLADGLPARLSLAKSLKEVFTLLRGYPSIGDFLAYQYTIDLNYGPFLQFSEMEFVMPGPGARDGIRKCFSDFGGLHESDIIRIVTERQEVEFARLGLAFPWLGGVRRLQLIDVQNVFCEVDKYARIVHPEVVGYSGRTRIKQRFSRSPDPMSCFFPPKWGLGDAASSLEVHPVAPVQKRFLF